jgi:hypothetical protein
LSYSCLCGCAICLCTPPWACPACKRSRSGSCMRVGGSTCNDEGHRDVCRRARATAGLAERASRRCRDLPARCRPPCLCQSAQATRATRRAAGLAGGGSGSVREAAGMGHVPGCTPDHCALSHGSKAGRNRTQDPASLLSTTRTVFVLMEPRTARRQRVSRTENAFL